MLVYYYFFIYYNKQKVLKRRNLSNSIQLVIQHILLRQDFYLNHLQPTINHMRYRFMAQETIKTLKFMANIILKLHRIFRRLYRSYSPPRKRRSFMNNGRVANMTNPQIFVTKMRPTDLMLNSIWRQKFNYVKRPRLM